MVLRSVWCRRRGDGVATTWREGGTGTTGHADTRGGTDGSRFLERGDTGSRARGSAKGLLRYYIDNQTGRKGRLQISTPAKAPLSPRLGIAILLYKLNLKRCSTAPPVPI
jgi:hypothetical protein